LVFAQGSFVCGSQERTSIKPRALGSTSFKFLLVFGHDHKDAVGFVISKVWVSDMER
jgi:hypothetical protein